MNQILEYSPNKNSGGGSSGSDKIIRVFALILMVFAVCFLAVGAYGVIKKKSNAVQTSSTAPTKAEITVETADTTATIKVRHDKAIEKVIYSWNDGKETTDKGNGTSEKEIEIQLPAGENTLNVKVIDVDGVETSYKKTINAESGTDIMSPVIKITVTEEKKIRIVATDETEMSYITYKWNNDEEVRVEDLSEDKKTIQIDIDILKGNNDLTVVAVDSSNRTTTESNAFAGVTKPEVVITVASDKKSVNVTCSHENGLKKVTLTLNGEEIAVNPPEGVENPKNMNFPVELPEGNSTVKVTALSVDDTTTEVTEEIIPDEPEETLNENIAININRLEDNNNKVKVSADYENGIKEIKLNINDVDYPVGIDDVGATSLGFELDLVQGNNRITVTIIGVDNTQNIKVEEFFGE